MPRKARYYSKSEYNHVIVQGINREYIFNDDKLKKTYLEIMKKNLDGEHIKLLSYCVMSNHSHMLVYSKDINYISEFMLRTNTSYAKKYNKIMNRVGYVFRDRYYSQEILSQKQLYNCLVYIHKNPLKAGMVKRLDEYRFSSYNEYNGKLNLITKEGIELVFGTADSYKDIFDTIHKKDNIKDILDIEEKKSIDDVVKKYMKELDKNFEQIKSDKYYLGGLFLKLQEESRLSLRDIAKMYGMGKDKVRSLINIAK